jgi:hypothetical protein
MSFTELPIPHSPLVPMVRIEHGADPTVVRPSGAMMVTWVGTVVPNNMVDPDILIRTDIDPDKYRGKNPITSGGRYHPHSGATVLSATYPNFALSMVTPSGDPFMCGSASMRVSTGTADSQFVVCLYESVVGRPGALLASGAVDTSTAGQKTATFATPVYIDGDVFAGGYWFGGTKPTLMCYSAAYIHEGWWTNSLVNTTTYQSGLIGPTAPTDATPPATFAATGPTTLAVYTILGQ